MARRTYDPLAPLRPRAVRRQAAASARASILPLLAELNREFERRSRAGQAAIGTGTEALAHALAPLAGQTHATYGAAEAEQRAVDAALADRLARVGGEVGSAVTGAAGVPAGSAPDLGVVGRGAAAAGSAMGSAALANLIAHGAAAESYAGELPAFARAGGAQRSAQLGSQLESERATQAGTLRSKIPGLFQQFLQQGMDREFQKGVAIQSGLASRAKLGQQAAYESARLAQGQQSLNLRAQKQQVDNLFKQAGMTLDQKKYQLAVQREVRLAKAKKGAAGGFTPSQISKFRATAIDTVKDWKHGIPAVTNASGQVKTAAVPARPRDPRGAFRYLVLHGIPPSMADWAVGQVYGRWKAPGERSGRGAGGTGPR